MKPDAKGPLRWGWNWIRVYRILSFFNPILPEIGTNIMGAETLVWRRAWTDYSGS